MNILAVRKLGLCSGCGACVIFCPIRAIVLQRNRTLNAPVVDNSNCIDCEKCLEVCPGYDNYGNISSTIADSKFTNHNQLPKCLICYSNDQTIRNDASSGGYISTLLTTLLEKGIIDGVITLKNDTNDTVEWVGGLITDIHTLNMCKGSKYFPVSVCEGLKEIAERKGSFAFVGKPCEVHAARLVAQHSKFRGKLVLLISLFCHHTPSRNATLEFLTNNGIKKEVIGSLNYRGNGWPGHFQVFDTEGDILLEMEYSKLWDKYLSKSIPLPCKVCGDPFGDFADISVGDAWGFYDSTSQGHSAVLLRTKTGINFHKFAVNTDSICCSKTTLQKILHGQKNLVVKIQNKSITHEAYRFLKNHSMKNIIDLLFRRKLPLIYILRILRRWNEIRRNLVKNDEL